MTGAAGATGHLALGANLGDRRAQLQAAVDALALRGVRVTSSSSVYETDPVGPVADQPPFLNAVVAVETALEPEAVLGAAKAVERALGRQTDPEHPEYVFHGPRPIDVDVLLLGDRVVRTPRLVVPHAAMAQRRFVLIPLLELDFEVALPGGERLSDVLAALPVAESVRRAGPPLTPPATSQGRGACDSPTRA
jgi:2-amino-4-hydroxy-6-hydroxymethyldihydropteridine diphosphokinase